MQKIFFTLLLLAFSPGVYAADFDMTSERQIPLSEEDGNVAIIRQTGGANVIRIEQSGDENLATTGQNGESNDVAITQTGKKNNLEINQQGDNNSVTRSQTGESRAVINQNGEIKTIFQGE